MEKNSKNSVSYVSINFAQNLFFSPEGSRLQIGSPSRQKRRYKKITITLHHVTGINSCSHEKLKVEVNKPRILEFDEGERRSVSVLQIYEADFPEFVEDLLEVPGLDVRR